MSVIEDIRAESQRYFHLRDVRWADSGNGKDFTFEGVASVFDSWSEPLWTPRGFFRERIRPGAFTSVLARNPDVRLLKNHDKNLVLARTKAGTLDLEETQDSLRVWARVAKTTYATDLRMSMERGDIDGMSFLFETDYEKGADDNWYIDDDTGEVRRDVFSVSDLIEVTIATFPAYAETEAVMREMRQRGIVPRNDGWVTPNQVRAKENLPAQKAERITPRAYARCRQVVSETPWCIKPSYLDMILGILGERIEGHRLSDEQIRERIGAQRDNEPTNEGSIAVVPLVGPVYSRAGAMQQISAAKSLDAFREQFKQAVYDPAVKAILLDIDSPGGTADMVYETAMEIRAARSQKPIVAVANGMAASAAYWIASAATEFAVTPSGEVGSIGVYAAHTDVSKKEELQGTKTSIIKAGKFKAEGNPFEPLSEEARANIQKDVNAVYSMFVESVARNRGTSKTDVLDNFGGGRTLMAKDALEVGMVDSIETYDQVLSRLQSVVGESRSVSFPTFYQNNFATTTGTASTLVTVTTDSTGGVSANINPVRNDLAHANEETPPNDGPVEDVVFESRDNLRDYLGLSVAQVDPAGIVDDAETVDDNPLAVLKARSSASMQRAREDKVRLTKEMLGESRTRNRKAK